MRFFLLLLLTLVLVLLFSGVTASQRRSEPLLPDSHVRVPEHVAEQNILIKVDPVYPEFALRGRLEGTVSLGITVDAGGRVLHVLPLAGPQELYAAAIKAVRQWRFHPYRLNGVGVPFDTRVRIRFKLPEVSL